MPGMNPSTPTSRKTAPTSAAVDWTGLRAQTARGYVVAARDCRGQGVSSEDTGGHKGTTHHGHIIRGLDDHVKQRVWPALDIAAGAVLLASIVAAVIGTLVFLNRLFNILDLM